MAENIDAERERAAFEAWAKETYEPRLGKDWKCVTWSINHGDKALAAFKGGIEYARRTPSASIGEDGVPELPQAAHRGPDGTGSYFDSYTADQMHQYAHDAVAAYRRAREATTVKNAVVRFDSSPPGDVSPQAAQGVKTWYERMPEHVKQIGSAASQVAYMECEIRDLRDQLARTSDALRTIALWELPSTGKFWNDGKPVSYEVEHGSNGAREFMRQVAFQALAAPPLSCEQQEKGVD